MPNFAELVLDAKTEGLLKGKRALEETTAAGTKTERAVKGTEGAFDKAGSGAKRATPKVKSFAAASEHTTTAASAAGKAVGGMVAAFVSFQGIKSAVGKALEFNAAVAETSTLLKGTSEELDMLRNSARGLAREFGGSATDQVRAFYQAISSGAAGVSEATDLLRTSNLLAKGGVTDITTSVDILTSATNAYALSGLKAADAADAIFVGVKAGKTTVSELGRTLGNIIPIASSLGVGFDEVVAATAALTTQGQSTSIAVTGIRQALAAVLKPTKEASDAAEDLGIDFSTAGLKAKGFGDFIADIIKKTGGSQEALAQLFGSVEALNAVLAFTGGAGEAYASTMDMMVEKSGAAQEAANKISKELSDRLNKQLSKFVDTATQVGLALLRVIVPAMEAFNEHIGKFTAGATAAAIALAAMGGPITVVAALLGVAAVGFARIFTEAPKAEKAFYDAAAGNEALNTALGIFHSSAAPEAAKSAIDLANDNVKLAESSLNAAEAALAQVRAEQALVVARTNSQPSNFFADDERRQQADDLAVALNELAIAESAIAAARAGRLRTANVIVGSMSDTMTAADKAAKDLNATVTVTTGVIGGVGKSSKTAEKEIKKLADTMERLEFDADPLKKYNYEIGKLDEMLDKGLSPEAYAKAVSKLNDELADSYPAVKLVSDAFSDWLSRGLKDFKGFVKDILSGFKNMLLQMIATAARNKIMISMGLGGAAGGGTAAMAQSMMGGGGGGAGMLGQVGGGSLMGSIGMGGGLAGSFLAGGAGLVSSFMGAGGGFAAAGSYMSAVLGTATSSMAGFAAAAGAVALPLLAVGAAFSFFKSKTKLLDKGIQVTTKGVGVLVNEFEKVKKTKFWGLSKKIRETFTKAEPEIANPIKKGVLAMQKSIWSAAKTLGFGGYVFSKFSHSFKLSLKGMTEEEATKAIQEEFVKMGDSMASLVPHISSLNELFQAADQRWQLQNRLLKLQGKEEEILARMRQRELAGTHKLNRSLLKSIYAIEDKQMAEAKAARAAEIAAAKAAARAEALAKTQAEADRAAQALMMSLKEITDQRIGLETRLLQLQGNTAELRRRELLAINPANRALQIMIWGLEDAKKAMDDINAIDFATRFDFQKAQALARNGIKPSSMSPSGTPLPSTNSSISLSDPATVSEMYKLREEVRMFRDEQRQLGLSINSNTKKTSKTLEKFDEDGLPPERV